MEKMYEVLRFVEKGTECQPSIDCLQGELLIYYLRDNTQLDKAVLFEWFRQIAGEIRKYQQSRRGQNYRCLTPYSIVVTEEGELLLKRSSTLAQSTDTFFTARKLSALP